MTIFQSGDTGGILPKVLTGAVMLYTIAEDGHRQIVDLAGPGDLLHFEGATGVVDCYAEALTDCQIAYFPATALLANSETAEYVIEQMRNRIALERRHIKMMGRKSATDRLADFMDIMADCLGADTDTIPLPLTRQQIADFTGLTLETVSRTFAKWEREQRLTRIDAVTYRRSEPLAA